MASLTSKLKDRVPAPVRLLRWEVRSAARYVRFAARDLALELRQSLAGETPSPAYPQHFTDKIRWRMLHDRRPLLQMCSDRLAARDFVAARAGKQYLVPLLGVFDRPEQVPWVELSPPYVVKATHGSGWNLIIREPGEVDPERSEQMLNRWLKTSYYHLRREWSYKHVPRKIIVERFVGIDGMIPEDFKFHCFDGEPRAIAICYNRFTPAERWTWRDPSWNVLAFISPVYPPGPPTAPPSRLEEMLGLARVLSRGFDYLRVDLYCVGDQVYFGELTTTQGAGNRPYTNEGEAWMGAFWHLPTRAEVRRAPRSGAQVPRV
jgi:hypothetical protein